MIRGLIIGSVIGIVAQLVFGAAVWGRAFYLGWEGGRLYERGLIIKRSQEKIRPEDMDVYLMDVPSTTGDVK